jgi:hypothetical protein
MVCMPTTPTFITVRRVISWKTIEKLYTAEEISRNIALASQFGGKAQWFYGVPLHSQDHGNKHDCHSHT